MRVKIKGQEFEVFGPVRPAGENAVSWGDCLFQFDSIEEAEDFVKYLLESL
jgi:hypothetical protein